MTLPFRGRHHDHESTHDRARALISTELIQPLPDDDGVWLARHLEACAECTRDREAYLADRALLRGLRKTSPEPPRDLWARTAAAIEHEARGRRRGPAGATARSGPRSASRGLPLGVAAGALVVLVVVGSALLPGLLPQAAPPGPSAVAVATPVTAAPQPTPLAVAAGDVGWVRPAANGRWELVISKVDEVCPQSRLGCESLGADDPSRTVDLGGSPTGLTMSPDQDQLVVQSQGNANTSQPDKIYVVPLATDGPTVTDPPTAAPGTETPPTAAPPTKGPAETPRATTPVVLPSATPGSTPSGAIEIASGVTLVGEAAYSADGRQIAFSARPADGSTGPDLYLWSKGDAEAVPVTTDHRTYFSGWLGDQVLASRVLLPASVPESSPGASGELVSPAPSPEGSAASVEFHPVSFLFDPATGVRTDLTEPDVWLPVVDAGRRVTAYWSGTVVPTPDGLDWQLGEGQLVLDRWVEPGAAPSPSEPAAASSDPSTKPAADPSRDPSAAPLEVVGPAGSPVPLEVDAAAEFKALFDTEGARLAIWATDELAAEVGRLYLVVLDPATGEIDADIRPLAGEPALRGFSIDRGRLAWVSPRGQDGQESAVQVLGWQGRNFGEIRTIPAKDLFIVR